MRKKPYPANAKQKLLAAKLLQPGMTQERAFVEVYQPKGKNTHEMASMYAKRQGVQRSINEIIERICPHIGDTAVSYLQEVLTDPKRPDMVKLKALEQLTKWMGWQTSKIEKKSLNATVDLNQQYALPGIELEVPELEVPAEKKETPNGDDNG